jgi:hypothetical protein
LFSHPCPECVHRLTQSSQQSIAVTSSEGVIKTPSNVTVKKPEDPLLLERGDMGLEVLLRSWRKRRQPVEADPPDSPDLPERPDTQDKSANDNGKAWPLIPFPDGWLGG